jgi:hypothetical protein
MAAFIVYQDDVPPNKYPFSYRHCASVPEKRLCMDVHSLCREAPSPFDGPSAFSIHCPRNVMSASATGTNAMKMRITHAMKGWVWCDSMN